MVAGRVQGVCYRSFACAKAKELKLHGFVQNCSDGAVELVAEGEISQLQELVEWCRKGPPHAVVTNVKIEWWASVGSYQDFEIKY